MTVHGFLIGALPDAQNPNDKQLLLLEKSKNAQPSTKWVVMGVRSLLERAMDTHLAVIKALESDLRDEEVPEANGATGMPAAVADGVAAAAPSINRRQASRCEC